MITQLMRTQGWLPLSIRHIVTLRRQMAMLSETKIHLSRERRTVESLGHDLAGRTSRTFRGSPGLPRSPLQFFARSKDAPVRSRADAAELRVHYLWRVCWLRSLVAACASAPVALPSGH